jgi:hypothetical protein
MRGRDNVDVYLAYLTTAAKITNKERKRESKKTKL